MTSFLGSTHGNSSSSSSSLAQKKVPLFYRVYSFVKLHRGINNGAFYESCQQSLCCETFYAKRCKTCEVIKNLLALG